MQPPDPKEFANITREAIKCSGGKGATALT